MLHLIISIVLIIVIVAQENTILKQEQGSNKKAVNVVATSSHKYISNSSPTKIGILFDIKTSNTSDQESTSNVQSRSPYELAIVLDRSGSMHGKKIEQAKLAMLGIVDNMIDGDIIHIIQYDHSVQVSLSSIYSQIRVMCAHHYLEYTQSNFINATFYIL